jgi:peptidoglycan-associated lipoprotein
MRQKLLGLLAIGLVVAGCESTEPYKDDANLSGNTFGEWPNKDAAGVPVPGSRADFEKNVKNTVHFATNKSHLTNDAKMILKNQAEWLKKWPNVDFVIEGHCDERGTVEYNMALGQRRAAAVKKFLVSHGISPKRVEIVSFGKERPVAMGHDETAWAENRRSVTVIR